MTIFLFFVGVLALARIAFAVRDLIDCIPKSNDVMIFF